MLHVFELKQQLECTSFTLLKFVFGGLVVVTFLYFCFHNLVDRRTETKVNVFSYFNASSLAADNASQYCAPLLPRNGPILNYTLDSVDLDYLERVLYWLEEGGVFVPVGDCVPRDAVAIIVPYRDRESHLKIFLYNIHHFLVRQNLFYGIFVVEPIANETFNRGKLMNIGFQRAMTFHNWSCIVFHDVDLLPENDGISYDCRGSPVHLSIAVDKFKYKLPYSSIFGGVTALTPQQFIRLNGYSNDFWGWGGEDDDMSWRLRKVGLSIHRYSDKVYRYKMLKHDRDKLNPTNACRHRLLMYSGRRWRKSGLNTLDYVAVSIARRKLFTSILVSTLEIPSRREISKICSSKT